MRPIGPWISRLMGFEEKYGYVEPFAGMLGVMLQRPRARFELINDSNGDLVNWWRCIRDKPEEMDYRICNTPFSREIFVQSLDTLRSDEKESTVRALAFHVVVQQSMNQAVISTPGQWSVYYSTKVGSRGLWKQGRVPALAARLRLVQIENRDALEILSRTAQEQNILIYCDPPYRNSNVSPYGGHDIDYEIFTEKLLSQKGRVAVSGYGDDYDHLGWHRYEIETIVRHFGENAHKTAQPRREVLWMNYASEAVTRQGNLSLQQMIGF